MGLMRDLDGLNAAYASMHEDGPMMLTKADKVGNTPAWRNRHKKSVKTGKPLYKMADHLKDEYESELWDTVAHNLTELHHLGGVPFKVVPLNEDTLKKELKDLSKAGKTGKGKYVKKADEIEEQKDTPDQVKAVIAFDKARKGTRDAVYDTEHGKKKQAKKERDYAKWQRDKGAEDAQKSGHPWEHAKGSTREKEGKKSVKHAHIKDAYNLIYREDAQSDAVAQMSGAGGDPQDDAIKQVVRAEKKKKKVKKEDKDWGYDKKGNSLNPVDQMKKKRKDDDLFGSPKKKVKEALASSGQFTMEEIERIIEAERSLSDRLARKRKLYDKTVKKAMDFARDEGEASGHARYRMGSIDREMDGIKAKMKEKK